jgi:hypothetical protein
VRLAVFFGCIAVIAAVFAFFVRPWYLRWGATDVDVLRPTPGDGIVPGAASQETRAITIRAPMERVWPWLAQIGQDRGGFYSFDLLENVVGCQMPTVDRVHPELQSWQIGDKLWMYPPKKAGGIGFATQRVYTPSYALAFGTRVVGTPLSAPENGSWTFDLDPINDSTTRLLVRGRGAAGRLLLGVAFDRSIFEPVHFAMERRMMTGIQQLAEGGDRGRLPNHLQILLWTITFAILSVSAVMILGGISWPRAVAAFLVAAAVFQILTLGQPPVPFGAVLTAFAAFMTLWPSPKPITAQ